MIFTQEALYLFRSEKLKTARQNWLIRLLLLYWPLEKAVRLSMVIAYTTYLMIAYLVPGVLIYLGQINIVSFSPVFINAIYLFLFVAGLFTGANVLSVETRAANERLMYLPVLLKDIIQYRLCEVLKIALHLFLLVPGPIQFFISLQNHEPATFVLLQQILAFVMSLGFFFAGVIALISIIGGRWFKKPEQVFIRIFIGLVFCGIFTLRLARVYPLFDYMNNAVNTYTVLALIVPSKMIAEGVYVGKSLMAAELLLLLFYSAFLFISLSKLTKMIERRIDLLQAESTISGRSSQQRISLDAIDRLLSFLPVRWRVLLAKDLTIFSRLTGVLLRIGLMAVFVIFVLSSNYSRGIVRFPELVLFYMIPFILVGRVLLPLVGREKSVINLMMQLWTFREYIRARIAVNVVIAAAVTTPVIIAMALLAMGTLSGTSSFFRITLIVGNMSYAILLATVCSLAFAQFNLSTGLMQKRDISDWGTLGYYILGMFFPLSCYQAELMKFGGNLVIPMSLGFLSIVVLLAFTVKALYRFDTQFGLL